MFKRLAKFRLFHSRGPAPVQRAKPANDNLPSVRRPARRTKPRLVCHWSLIDGTDWAVAGNSRQQHLATPTASRPTTVAAIGLDRHCTVQTLDLSVGRDPACGVARLSQDSADKSIAS